MEGTSPDIPRPRLPENSQIAAFVTRREAVSQLETARPDLDNRFVANVSKGTIFFVRQQYDPDDPRKDAVEHAAIVSQLLADKKISPGDDVRGGYVLILDPDTGEMMHTNGAGTITQFDQDPQRAQIAFDAFLTGINEDPNDPHFFVIDRNYGKKEPILFG